MRLIADFLTPAYRHICLAIATQSNHWADGRQGTGYQKLDLAANTILRPIVLAALNKLEVPADHGFWDCYLLRYPEGSFIPKHKDSAEMFDMQHHRVNMLVKRPTTGGDLIIDGAPISMKPGDAVIFRPDSEEHEVTECRDERLVLTVGCWKSAESV